MTHIDPFAPGDSPQHPANWGKEPPALSVEDAIANTYQWRRDHFAMASEAGQEIPSETLEQRHERYGMYLDQYGDPYERQPDSEFVSMPTLLRREVFADLDDDEVDEWNELFGQHGTEDESDPMWVEGSLPDLAELRARDDVVRASAEAAEKAQEDGTPVPEMLLSPPRSNALKEEWVDYALAVDKARGGTLTPEQANAMSIADLKATYKPQVS